MIFLQIKEVSRKSEQRIEQLKKTFGSQVEGKLSTISQLEEKNVKLKQEIDELKEKIKENDVINEDLESLKTDLENSTTKVS